MRRDRTTITNGVRTAFGVALVTVSLVALAGCSDDEKKTPTAPGGGTPTSSGFTGFMADGQQSGKIVVTVNSTTLAGRVPLRSGAAEVTASATFNFGGGGSMTASGVYSEESDTLNLSGGGYTFIAELESGDGPPSLVGQFTGPGTMGFFGVISNEFAPQPFCGNWFNMAVNDSGTFNVVANDTAFAAVFIAADDQELGSASGQVTAGTGTTRSLHALEGDMSTFTIEVNGTWDTATGDMSGDWTYTSYDVPTYGTSDSGTWEASACP